MIEKVPYPGWATPYDIDQAKLVGTGAVLEEEWQVCPYHENTEKCEQGQSWNELACKCFTLAKCKKLCTGENEELIDTEMCQCVDKEKAKAELYPTWATDEHIRAAK